MRRGPTIRQPELTATVRRLNQFAAAAIIVISALLVVAQPSQHRSPSSGCAQYATTR
jgi:hypothetical protein